MKIRADKLVVLKGLASTEKEAQALIMSGQIVANDQRVDKAGSQLEESSFLRKKGNCPFVSRGGYKLEKGLTHFDINPAGLICVDIGASSGGFTDCLLQHQAATVYAIDVAYGQLDWKIRQDHRVEVIERFNARKLTLDQLSNNFIDLVVTDVSFISLTKILEPLPPLFKTRKNISVVALIKPQFELPKSAIGKNGVVKSPELHQQAIDIVHAYCSMNNLTMSEPVASPILGPKGNREFLVHITGY